MDGWMDGWTDLEEGSLKNKKNLLRICLLISFVGSNQHWRERARGGETRSRKNINLNHETLSQYSDVCVCSFCMCTLRTYLAYSTSCVGVCMCENAYLLFVAVCVRESKVVLLHQVKVLTHLKEQVLALGTFLQRKREIQNTRIQFVHYCSF